VKNASLIIVLPTEPTSHEAADEERYQPSQRHPNYGCYSKSIAERVSVTSI